MRLNKERGFTLVELLVVMAIIIILTGLVLSLISYVNKRAAKTRAVNEIAALSGALENFKADNGIYPDDGVMNAGSYTKGWTDKLDARANGDPTDSAQPAYIPAGLVLYRALSGDTNLDRTVNTTDETHGINGTALSTPMSSLPTVYYNFNASQVLPTGGTGTITSIVDPFGFPYGYSTAYQGDIAINNTSNPPVTTTPANGFNPTFDLWSTAATTTTSTAQMNTNRLQWITNWQNMVSGTNSGQ